MKSLYLLIIGGFLGFFAVSTAQAQVNGVERLSVDGKGDQILGDSTEAVASSDGQRVAFVTTAAILPGDDNQVSDVYLLDRGTNLILRVSQGLDNTDTDGPSGLSIDNGGRGVGISADGTLVVFASQATNLVVGDQNNASDIFLFNTVDQSLTLVSENRFDNPADGASYNPVISADGAYVAFDSSATDMISLDQNGKRDIFRYDVGQTSVYPTAISVTSTYDPANGDSILPAISEDGNLITYQSDASNLSPNDANNVNDVYLYDVNNFTTRLLSTTSGGSAANGASRRPVITPDGTRVAFESSATDIVLGDTNSRSDIFVLDVADSTFARVSRATGGAQGNADSSNAAISTDGRYVAFQSQARNLVSGDTNGSVDVFLRDLQTDRTTRLSLSKDSSQLGRGGTKPFLIGSGARCIFVSDDSKVVAGDTNAASDVFLAQVAQVVTPDFIIEEPPVVTVRNTQVRVVLPEFLGASSELTASLAAFVGRNVGAAKKTKRKKLTFRYEVENAINPSTSDEVRRRITERNAIAFKNVPAGTHSIRYRMVIKRSNRVIGRTPYSPTQGYTVG